MKIPENVCDSYSDLRGTSGFLFCFLGSPIRRAQVRDLLMCRCWVAVQWQGTATGTRTCPTPIRAARQGPPWPGANLAARSGCPPNPTGTYSEKPLNPKCWASSSRSKTGTTTAEQREFPGLPPAWQQHRPSPRQLNPLLHRWRGCRPWSSHRRRRWRGSLNPLRGRCAREARRTKRGRRRRHWREGLLNSEVARCTDPPLHLRRLRRRHHRHRHPAEFWKLVWRSFWWAEER